MAHRNDRAKRGGFTLIEILIALAILGIVVMLATGTFQGMMEKYRVEGETKQIFADLMDARGRAMQRNRAFFVKVTGDRYATYEDTTPAPDGNGTLESTDAVSASATVRHTITCDPGGLSDFRFSRDGIASATGTIRLSSTAQPDYDCITVRETRIKMGKWNGTACYER